MNEWTIVVNVFLDSMTWINPYSNILKVFTPNTDLSRKMKVVTEVLDSFICESPIVMAPCKIFLYISSSFEWLKCLHDVEVGDTGQLTMLGKEKILFSHKDPLCNFISLKIIRQTGRSNAQLSKRILFIN